MHLSPDGAGYRAAYRDRQDAGQLPDFGDCYPLITVTPDSVSLNDAAIERAIDAVVAGVSHLGRRVPATNVTTTDLVECARLVLKQARAQRIDWLDNLGRWWTSHLLNNEAAIERLLDRRRDLESQLGQVGVWAYTHRKNRIAEIDAQLAALGCTSSVYIARLIERRNELSLSFYWLDDTTAAATIIKHTDAELLGVIEQAAPAASTPATGGPIHHGESTKSDNTAGG